MQTIKRSPLVKIIIILILIVAIFCIYQFLMLQKAHSSLENYAAFRGCIGLTNQTATSTDCSLQSGQKIKLVKINDKWYLEGDGPGKW